MGNRDQYHPSEFGTCIHLEVFGDLDSWSPLEIFACYVYIVTEINKF